ncbi:hypothetical protein CAPTEDRAFT_193903 [Capitella teleta]|uniref:Uncharacterized protein n=1 Tax=Capitella teleta TaxID=283909 RepID=R7UY32_CAPTE|nr:hypothetical protein CAPTEDRAFT_193903 [Capitella teleta]|eukprot:ELU11493.1 hypothetical protein CAPTEDRAFT_193903 [Capitella teleta]
MEAGAESDPSVLNDAIQEQEDVGGCLQNLLYVQFWGQRVFGNWVGLAVKSYCTMSLFRVFILPRGCTDPKGIQRLRERFQLCPSPEATDCYIYLCGHTGEARKQVHPING